MTTGKNLDNVPISLPHWDSKKWDETVDFIQDYLETCYTEKDKKLAALPDSSPPNQPSNEFLAYSATLAKANEDLDEVSDSDSDESDEDEVAKDGEEDPEPTPVEEAIRIKKTHPGRRSVREMQGLPPREEGPPWKKRLVDFLHDPAGGGHTLEMTNVVAVQSNESEPEGSKAAQTRKEDQGPKLSTYERACLTNIEVIANDPVMRALNKELRKDREECEKQRQQRAKMSWHRTKLVCILEPRRSERLLQPPQPKILTDIITDQAMSARDAALDGNVEAVRCEGDKGHESDVASDGGMSSLHVEDNVIMGSESDMDMDVDVPGPKSSESSEGGLTDEDTSVIEPSTNEVEDNTPEKLSIISQSLGDVPPSIEVPNDAPKWLSMAVDRFQSLKLGTAFDDLLRLLVELEKMYTWQTAHATLEPKRRPELLTKWVSGGHFRSKTMPTVKTGELEDFKLQWGSWWKALQPQWRVIRGDDVEAWSKDTYGDDWSLLRVPGPNGLLGIVAMLAWWGVAVVGEEEGESKRWGRVVLDVMWMVKGLVADAEKKDPVVKKKFSVRS